MRLGFASLSPSDEDDALFEKLSEEQWRLECLMQLLTELKDCDLPGDFFLDLLEVRTTHLPKHHPVLPSNIPCLFLPQTAAVKLVLCSL